MELFRSTNIDWLGKKWYFLGFSLIFSVAGLLEHPVLASHSARRGLQGRNADSSGVCPDAE